MVAPSSLYDADSGCLLKGGYQSRPLASGCLLKGGYQSRPLASDTDSDFWQTPSSCKKKQSRFKKEETIRAKNRLLNSRPVEFILNNGRTVVVDVNLEKRYKVVCFLYYIDENGSVRLLFLVSAKHGDLGALSGSFEWRTNEFIGCTLDELLNAIFITLIKEADEEINAAFAMEYLQKHFSFIAADPWFGKGKTRTDGLGPRENKYIPYTGVLNCTEWLLSNFKGATVTDCANEFTALLSTNNPYVPPRDGEIAGVEVLPLHRVPMNRVWAPHRHILTKNRFVHEERGCGMDSFESFDDFPTFKEVLGECVNDPVSKNRANPNYEPSVFVHNVRSLNSKDPMAVSKSMQFFRRFYPTLTDGANSESEVCANILALKTSPKKFGETL